MTDLIRRSVLIDEICRSSIYKWSIEEDQAAHNWALDIINSQPSVESSKGDYISRADAIDAVVSWTVEDRPTEVMPTDLVDRIKALPSAGAVQGEWKIDEYGIYHCPFCHAINNTVYKSFCPNCGVRMKGGAE